MRANDWQWGAPVPEPAPQDEYAERGVLGAILCQPDREHSAAILGDLAGFLDVRDFCREANQVVYAGVLSAYRREGFCLFADVLARLRLGGRLRGRLEQIGGSAYVTGLVVEAAPALVVREQALYVAGLGLRRLVMEARRRLPEAGAHGEAGAAEAVEAFARRVADKRRRLEDARRGVRGTLAQPGGLARAGMDIPE